MNTSEESSKIVTPEATEGYVLGRDATSKCGMHGKATELRASAAQAAVATTAATNSTPYGYSQEQADGIVTLLNEIRAALVEKGIIKGGA